MSIDAIKEKLEKEEEELKREIDFYKKEDPFLIPDRAITNTVDDDITEIEGHDRITATRLNLKQRLSEVTKALLRIEDKTFGVCKNCGKKILEERMKAMPTASFCIDCNSKK